MEVYSHQLGPQFVTDEAFDSTLLNNDHTESGNLICRVRLNVFLKPIEMKTGPCTGYYQEEDDRFGNYAWDRMLWESWKREYKNVLEDYWSAKFWLITPEGYDKLDYGLMRPNIRCDLKVEPVPFGGGAHQTFHVTRMADYRVNRRESGGTGFTGWLGDVSRGSEPDSETKLLPLSGVDHLFAMPQQRQHANLNKYFNWQAPLAKNMTPMDDSAGLHHDETTVRSRERWHARPWQLAMGRHTGVDPDKWTVTMSNVPPQRVPKRPLNPAIAPPAK